MRNPRTRSPQEKSPRKRRKSHGRAHLDHLGMRLNVHWALLAVGGSQDHKPYFSNYAMFLVLMVRSSLASKCWISGGDSKTTLVNLVPKTCVT